MHKICAICGKKIIDLIWVNDSYGIPYKGVCSDKCVDIAKNEIQTYCNTDDDDCMVGW